MGSLRHSAADMVEQVCLLVAASVSRVICHAQEPVVKGVPCLKPHGPASIKAVSDALLLAFRPFSFSAFRPVGLSAFRLI